MSAFEETPAEAESAQTSEQPLPANDAKEPSSAAKKWTIRGIPDDVREGVSQAARESSTTIGDMVTDALIAHLADLEIEAPGRRDLAAELDDIVRYFDERMTEIEQNLKPLQPDDFKLRLVERPWIRPAS